MSRRTRTTPQGDVLWRLDGLTAKHQRRRERINREAARELAVGIALLVIAFGAAAFVGLVLRAMGAGQ
jgi:hypothetical protein